MGLAALDHGDLCAMRVQLLRYVVTAGAGAEHKRLAAFPPLGVFEIAGVDLDAGKCFETGQVRRVGDATHAGRKEEMTRTHDAFRSASLPQCGAPLWIL